MGVKSPERWMAVESPTIRILTVIDCRLSDDASDQRQLDLPANDN